MAYEKTNWLDHIVERPRTYRPIRNEDGTVTMDPAFGEVTQQGTPVNADHLQKIEDELERQDQVDENLQEQAGQAAEENQKRFSVMDDRMDQADKANEKKFSDLAQRMDQTDKANEKRFSDMGTRMDNADLETKRQLENLKNYVDGGSLFFQDVSVPASAWATAEASKCDGVRTKYANVTLAGVTADMVPQVVFPPVHIESLNLSPIARTISGGIQIYAETVPTGAITIPTIICVSRASRLGTAGGGGVTSYTMLTDLPKLNGKTIIGDMKEEDPGVADWAKEATKPTYSAEELGALSKGDIVEIDTGTLDEMWKND